MRSALALLLGLMISGTMPAQAAPAKSNPDARQRDGDTPLASIIESLTPQERVGQLMLITMEGSSLGPNTAIAQLIREHNLGGVVLLAENDNINGQVNTPRLVQTLTTDLQTLAYDSAQATADRPVPRAFIPLFIATTHAGNGQPYTQIAWDTTPLPSLMAIGATWDPDYAQHVGRIAGVELDAMGINMLLGPALDVSQQPQTERTLDLGVNTFGGEPTWVGKMGQAYVTGVHEGSQGRIAVIAQHFPGLGLADADPNQQIPVVPRSADELRAFDLIPFYAVTGNAPDPAARVEGIQCANIRYQDTNIRTNTRPVCVDETAANALLQLDYFDTWRESGIMISSPLGSHAIRRYYNVVPFPHRQVAREAFLAGNDLLYLANFGTAPEDGQIENIVDVITFFTEQYKNDPVFRNRVDLALTRTLSAKLQLYDSDFTLDRVLMSPNDISVVGSATSSLYTIAQDGVTLLAPRRESLPPPPARDENIVIFTDVRLVKQCSYCTNYALVTVNALEVAIERMYGPYAGDQVQPTRVVSFSFSQLQSYFREKITQAPQVGNSFKPNQRIDEALQDVDWMVFVMFDMSPNVETSSILRDLLEAESSIIEDTHIVTIAFGAPTYLTATEISEFTAFFGLFSHTPPYIDAAARALFQENSLPGALPISLPATGYNVLDMTRPDPTQTIQIEIDPHSDGPTTIAASDNLAMQMGDELHLRTLPIVDHNGNIVPDNTPVEFVLTFITDNLQTRHQSVTIDGIARTTFRPTHRGQVQITASSLDATRAATFQITVNEADTAANNTGATEPTLADQTIPPGTTPTPTLDGTSIALNNAPGEHAVSPVSAGAMTSITGTRHRLEASDFVLSMFTLSLMSLIGFAAGRTVTLTAGGGVRVVLGSIIAGLTGYIYYGVNGPGVPESYRLLNNLAPMIITFVSGAVGLVYTRWILKHEWSDR